jgi:hypothetical protein
MSVAVKCCGSVFFGVTKVQRAAIRELGKSLFRGVRLNAQARANATAHLLTVIALADVAHWREHHDAIIRYCQSEGIEGRERHAVFDDRIRAAFKQLAARARVN